MRRSTSCSFGSAGRGPHLPPRTSGSGDWSNAAGGGLRVDTNFEEYARTGKVRVAGRTSFQLDVFANATEMAGSFLSVDHLIAKLLVLGELSRDDRLAARGSGKACPSGGALAAAAGEAGA